MKLTVHMEKASDMAAVATEDKVEETMLKQPMIWPKRLWKEDR